MFQLYPTLSLLIVLFISPFPNPTHAGDRHVIDFRSPGLYPKALTWDPSSQHFIVASLRRGTFHSISDAAVIETLTSSSSTILAPNSTILGLAVDNSRRRLLAAVNTPNPHIAAFQLHRSSLTPLFLSPLTSYSATDAAYGVALDYSGNAYVTNSGNNSIWKVDVNGTVTVLSTSKLFNNNGLNGIVYVKSKGYLLAVQSNTGKMFKIDAIDGTTRTVNLPEDLTLADGIAVRDDGVVVVVSVNCAWWLKSDDSWSGGGVIDKITLDREGFPSSVTIGGGGRVYVIYGYVEEGIMGNSEKEWFRVEEIKSVKESEGESVWPFVLIGLGLAYLLFWRFQMAQLVDKMNKKTA